MVLCHAQPEMKAQDFEHWCAKSISAGGEVDRDRPRQFIVKF